MTKRFRIGTAIGALCFGLVLTIIGIKPAASGTTAPAETDDPHYQYLDNENCGACHQEQLLDYKASMMGRTPHDKVFQQFYFATNARGKFDGIGFKGFRPEEAGDCASCHTPDVVLDAGHEVELQAAMASSKGISCDFCHTVKDVQVRFNAKDRRYDTRIWNTITRARGETKRGPLKDANSPFHGTKFSPIHTKSEFCAACHLNQEHLLSLDTYVSWKKAFDKGVVKQSCQQCHMPTGGQDRPIALGGPVRPAAQIHRHTFHGGHNAAMVKKAATMRTHVRRKGSELLVEVDVTNSGAGHSFPAGATLRNVLLVVDAVDEHGMPLQHIGGKQELLPPLAGTGNSPRDFGGHVGAMFARPFATKTGKVPAGGFNADRILFDTRIGPGETARRNFHFRLPPGGHGKVHVRLIYRWAYLPLVVKKGWQMEDIVVAQQTVAIR